MGATIIQKPKVDIDPKILHEIKTQTHEMGQVVVHCIHHNPSNLPALIRIWPSTYLFDQHSDHSSNLVHAENITYYPQWTAVLKGESFFSLIFSGLPKSCEVFDLIEDCNGGSFPFKVLNISRNEKDVYYVQV